MNKEATQEMIKDLIARAKRVAKMFPQHPDAGPRVTFVAYDELVKWQGENK